VRVAGLEPARGCPRLILSQMRLPFRHTRAGRLLARPILPRQPPLAPSTLPRHSPAAVEDEDEEKPIPPGARAYMTPAGAARMRAELHELTKIERPKIVEIVHWAAGNGDRSENGDYLYGKKRLREIDRRARFLGKRLEIAEIVNPADQANRDQVFFGATVTFVNDNDVQRTVTIVGADEADLSRGEVSLYSPIARALLRTRIGDAVIMHGPAGPETVEVLDIKYPEVRPGLWPGPAGAIGPRPQ
jgi:transcription elongation factor GreB